MVTRGEKSAPNQDPRNALGPATVVIVAEYKMPDPNLVTRGLSLHTASIRCTPADMFDMRLNSHSRLNLIMALLEAIDAGADEALMLDPAGFVSSCNATNFFCVRNGEVLTSSGEYCFNGVTRANVIGLCESHGIVVRLGDFTVSDAYAAEEAFVTGTFGGLTPVREIDGHRLSAALPGPVTRRLHALYEALKDLERRKPMGVPAIRIAMWSGPRNISTAMMRSFEARGDTAVSDEPFYAAYLDRTGIDHPMREEVIASQPRDQSAVAALLLGPVPGNKPIWYQKHMTLHLLEGDGRDWMSHMRNAFLIRNPASVLASYALKRDEVTLADIGFVQQRELFEAEAERLGRPPPVVDAADIVANPARTLERLCDALGIPYSPAMLRWPPGRRATDGVWAPAWYQSVEKSTGFEARGPRLDEPLPPRLQALADEAEPHYEALRSHRIT